MIVTSKVTPVFSVMVYNNQFTYKYKIEVYKNGVISEVLNKTRAIMVV